MPTLLINMYIEVNIVFPRQFWDAGARCSWLPARYRVTGARYTIISLDLVDVRIIALYIHFTLIELPFVYGYPSLLAWGFVVNVL